ncbi:MAG: hydroxymethylpyrimidine/phosphomethylpyrimidine kinase [Magnetococcales bacterium]|nr:hydroxymethylpyrimidine/phosphomethylpyrimidine kinase [Magnetococcales bacterium]MBF0156359.1 hydroxymethylpyrimidine/phosphomethylpyrimidine kinase [Magnetococcales bacterium]
MNPHLQGETHAIPPRVLIVAGSDPSGGAGLQADVRTVTALGGYPMTAVTAITVQDTCRVEAVDPLPGELVERQMRACLEDVGADVIKLGMLATADIVRAVIQVGGDYPAIPIVADPVLAGTGGGTLLDGAGRDLFLSGLLPRLTLLTPNLPEAGILTGLDVDSPEATLRAAEVLGSSGASVLITGGHRPGEEIVDLLLTGSVTHRFAAPRLPLPDRGGREVGCRGTGCILTSAIAVGVAEKLQLVAAIVRARAFLRVGLAASLPLGAGQRLMTMVATPRREGFLGDGG